MTTFGCGLFMIAVAALPLAAAHPRRPVPDAIRDVYRPLAFDQQTVTGVLGSRMRANIEGFLERIDSKQLIAPFEEASRIAASSEGNSSHNRALMAEQAGKFIDAAASAYDYTHDRHLKASLDRVASELLRLQSSDGYLGIYAVGKRWTTDDLSVQRYNLLGLLAYYRVTQNVNALSACQRIGSLLLNASSDPGSTAGYARLIEPMTYLYRYTGDTRYLDFCKNAARTWDHDMPKSNNQATYYPAGKLWSLIGLVELYRVTGVDSYLSLAMAAWRDIRQNGLLLTGAPAPSPRNNNLSVDDCTTVAWMKLTLEVLRITGQAEYGQELERTAYNQLFAGQDVRTGEISSTVPLSGTKNPTRNLAECSLNEAQGISLLPATVWGRYETGIVIIMFTGGRATFRLKRRATVQVYSEAGYPEQGTLVLHIEPSHDIRFPLRLRVPEWANSFIVDVGQTHERGKPGQLIAINREWKHGDTVKITMDLPARTISDQLHHPNQIAIQRGPQVLALAGTLNPRIKNLAAVVPDTTSTAGLKLTPFDKIPANWPGDQIYSIDGEYGRKRAQLLVAPFSDAMTYQIWMKEPAAGR